jgi:hypothetical protein
LLGRGHARFGLFLSSACALAACLVTNKVDYDEPIIPAQVERGAPRPDEFVGVPPVADEACQPNTNDYMAFSVNVSDQNREEKLQVRVLINHEIVHTDSLPITHDEQRDAFPFCLDESDLKAPCNLVEVLVASDFGTSSRPYFAPNEDLASAHWWVIGKAVDNTYASYLDCPDYLPDGGLP